MKTVFMVAEKPSLALSLAEILSDKKCSTRKGFNGACSVHEWKGIFQNQNVIFKMTSVCGHVMSLDFPGIFNNWDQVDPKELFDCPVVKKEATPKLKMNDFLSKESRGASFLVLWLDCDKEGENICFEVIRAVECSMNIGNHAIFRAKFSAITQRDIKGAMKTLGKPNENESLSVDARQELDLRIGCAFTRLQTKFFQGKYGDLDSNLISFGPCQTPTLGFCVERHDLIKSFKPETYWVLQVKAARKCGKEFHLSWERSRCFDKEVAMCLRDVVAQHSTAQVNSVTSKEKSTPRPLALNTVELMRVGSSGLGLSPQSVMMLAERLYTQGYISYPRTETTHYSENFDFKNALHLQSSNRVWGDIVKNVLSEGITKPRKGHDAGDHPPITPMRAAQPTEMNRDSWRVYEYITKHFIATLMPDCTFLQTTIKLSISTEQFCITGKVILNEGFTKIMDWLQAGDCESLPAFEKGDNLTILECKLGEKKTSPPDYLTESELITLMEKHGIGTDASIPVHINNICQRNYVSVENNRRLVPTNLGVVLVHGYQKIDFDLVLPSMRSEVETQLNLIAKGKADYKAVLRHALDIFVLKFEYFVRNICKMDELFEVSFSPLSSIGRPLSRCGKCRRYLKLVEMKPARLHCVACDETYSVPQNGTIRDFMENKCPLDDFELLVWSAGHKGKSFVFCPYCYNNPPFEKMSTGNGCNGCLHPDCEFSQNSMGVSMCMECPHGILVLDPSSGPKWKINCNICDVIIDVFEKANRVHVQSDKTCQICKSQILSVEYKEGKSELKNGLSKTSGCIFCDQNLSSFVKKHRANFSTTRGRGRGGPRGRGRTSRRNRGRGYGRS